MSQARPMRRAPPPPTVPAGVPVRAGAAAITRAIARSPVTSPQMADSALMPPPPIPACPSMSSSTSSHPSLSSLDSAFYERRASRDRDSRDYRIKTPLQESYGADNVEGASVDARFENLLERLQVPSTVRIKFSTVSKDVKMSILDSSLSSNPNILAALGLAPPVSATNGAANTNNGNNNKKLKNRLSTPLLRKTKSTQSMQDDIKVTYNVKGEKFEIVPPPKIGQHHRGQSLDIPTPHRGSHGPMHIAVPPQSVRFGSTPVSPRGSRPGTPETPDVFVHWLETNKGTDLNMDVNRAKKLRMLLRHEVTTWVGSFLDAGGYARILDRIQDLLDIEWREEQHDDKMLYELLRCVKALTTTEVGKAALRAHHPRPFTGLSELLFSEKKPGDLACRQIIIELWLFHFELFPSQTAAQRHSAHHMQRGPSINVTEYVRSLLLPEDKEDKTKDYHSFVTAAHRPRPFKAWVQELSDICRDYFWIMCHGSNMLWSLNEVDDKLVEKPVAPGGATGGVEFEAMGYVTMHFRLLNALVSHMAEESPEKARQLHSDLLMSGLDRILITMRKASTTYYPTLHLELARYVEALRRASPGEKLPYLISKMVGSPPEELRRHMSASEWLPRTSWEQQPQPQRQRDPRDPRAQR